MFFVCFGVLMISTFSCLSVCCSAGVGGTRYGACSKLQGQLPASAVDWSNVFETGCAYGGAYARWASFSRAVIELACMCDLLKKEFSVLLHEMSPGIYQQVHLEIRGGHPICMLALWAMHQLLVGKKGISSIPKAPLLYCLLQKKLHTSCYQTGSWLSKSFKIFLRSIRRTRIGVFLRVWIRVSIINTGIPVTLNKDLTGSMGRFPALCEGPALWDGVVIYMVAKLCKVSPHSYICRCIWLQARDTGRPFDQGPTKLWERQMD